MTSAIGIPTTRISDLFLRQRLLAQVQSDQRELFRLQNQLSTGYRFQLPSEDPVASLRVISLQRLLERKEQVQANLTTNQSYLSSTDAALSRVSELVTEIRAESLWVTSTIPTDAERLAVAQQVQQAISQLVDTGNQRFRGRHLFAGSTTEARPFEAIAEGGVKYFGNEEELLSYSDIDLLFATNVSGSEVFGAISEVVKGSVDLNPVLTYNTRLADLRGGLGIGPGSIAVSDGSSTSVIDISGAETIGDVAALIRANPPESRALFVEITATGLRIQLDPATGSGNLSIREVGAGTTADELGILSETGVGNNPIVGEDLNPILRNTTPLADILGTRSRAVIRSNGADNDIILEATTPGTLLDGVTISFRDDPGVAAGSETVDYDPVAKTIVVGIDEGHTTAEQVVAALNDPLVAPGLPFTARLDPLGTENGGRGLIPGTPPGEVAGTTAGGSGEPFDRDSGLQIVNGGATYTISLATAETIEDVINALNGSDAGVLAEINEDATGINVRSRISGMDFAIGENGGTTASQLGLRTFTSETRLESLNFGRGASDSQSVSTYAEATFESMGQNNDLAFRARSTGSEWNDFVISFVDSGGPPGSETLSYDPVAKTITFAITPGSTTANDVVNLFNTTPGARDDFEIFLAPEGEPSNDGNGAVAEGSVTTADGVTGGVDFVITRADGVRLEIEIAGLETIGDVLDQINTHPDNTPVDPGGDPALSARLAAYGNGIELVDDSVGSGNLRVSRAVIGNTAVELGLIPEGQESSTAGDPGAAAGATVQSSTPNSDLIFRGLQTGTYANGVQIIFQDTGAESFTYDPGAGTMTFTIIGGVTNANRIIELFNGDPAAASLYSVELDPNDGNTGMGAVDDNTANPAVMLGGLPKTLTGRDVGPLETEGLFTALLRLQQALESNDLVKVERAIEMLDQGLLELNFARAELGARQQGLDVLQDRLDTEDVELREVLSLEYDVDIVEVVSNLTAKQAAFEASLMSMARIFEMTLLDYL